MRQLFLILCLGSFCFSSNASAGSEAHGGNTLAAQIVVIADNVVSSMERLGQEEFPRIDLRILRDSASKARVVVTSEPVIGPDGKERDAINDPKEGLITFNKDRWLAMWGNAEAQVLLVLHEFNGISGIEESDNYNLSLQTLAKLKKSGVDLADLTDTGLALPLDFSGMWECRGMDLAGKEVIMRQVAITRAEQKPNGYLVFGVAGLMQYRGFNWDIGGQFTSDPRDPTFNTSETIDGKTAQKMRGFKGTFQVRITGESSLNIDLESPRIDINHLGKRKPVYAEHSSLVCSKTP